MNKLKDLLGETLYKKVTQKLNGVEIYLEDKYYIPKYRFDEINAKLKEQKRKNEELVQQINDAQLKHLKNIEQFKILNIIYKTIAKKNPKKFDMVLSFINSKNLTTDNAENSVKRQLCKIKRDMPSLFKEP